MTQKQKNKRCLVDSNTRQRIICVLGITYLTILSFQTHVEALDNNTNTTNNSQPLMETTLNGLISSTTPVPTTTTSIDKNEDEDNVESSTVIGEPLSVNKGENDTITVTIPPEEEKLPSTTVTSSSESELGTSTPSNNGEEATLKPELQPKSISHDDGNLNTAVDEDENAQSDKIKISPEDESPAPSRFSKVNMTHSDLVFETGTKNEQESADAWHDLQKKTKKGLTKIIGALVPFALNMSSEAKISSNCSGAFLKWILSMNQLKAWSLKMLDASGKPSAGLLEGSLTMFGNHRECLKVRAPDDDEIDFADGAFREYFRGKYCIIQAKPWLPKKDKFYNLNAKLKQIVESDSDNEWYDKTIFEEFAEWFLAFNFVSMRFDICVPSLCGRQDMQKVINYLMDGVDLRARVLRCETDASDKPNSPTGVTIESPLDLTLSESSQITITALASSANMEYNRGGLFNFANIGLIGWVLIPVTTILIVTLATCLSLVVGSNNKQSNLQAAETRDKKTSRLRHTIKSLSLSKSVNSHLNIDYDQVASDKPLSIYGLRFVLVIWIIIVDSAVNLKYEYLRELLMLKDFIFWWPMQIIINSTLQFDSLILVTAFVMGYRHCFNDHVTTAKAMTKYVLDKYIRLMPSIMLMVSMTVLLPLMYKGPVWNDYVLQQSTVCQSNGLINAFFLQNYLDYKQIVSRQSHF